ncbi:serine/threonine-protein kinase [Brevibacterium sanguinis]|uniref:non-specific serine/threonine protein kinase n=2 Tax=Brevibacterium TaxID=1696 RepID=A0A366IEL8_9MICO|nr:MULTISPECIES: PASTA domain-containing protein [Brevibacterium]RBP61913.1 serine/threonine-protein kinase [Brevibacterium sanguinis]RBP68641.1 serine/threonine-protein kinase [Brevibacterium celere]
MSTRTDPLIGVVLNERYRIDAKIARGGMAMVYRGTDLRLDREIAIKVMHEHLINDETFVERFRREAINAGRLTHPNLVAIHDQARDGDIVYLVMEYLPSVTLRRELKHRGTFTPRQAIVVLDAILAALEAVHSTGIIHRDLKPDNVLLGIDGQVKLADFGLARAVTTATTTKTLIGTVGYVAPELVTRTGADARTDLYTVGIMFYEMLTGMQPYTDDVPIQVAYRHVHDTVPPPSEQVPGLSPRLDALVLWATSKDPADRPDDAAQFRHALAEARAEMSDADLDLGAPEVEAGEHAPALTASIDLGTDAPKEKRSRTDEIPYLEDDEEGPAEASGDAVPEADDRGASDSESDAKSSAAADGAVGSSARSAGGLSAAAKQTDSRGTREDDSEEAAGSAAAASVSSASAVPTSVASAKGAGTRRRRLATTVAAGVVVLALLAWMIVANLPAPAAIVPGELAGKQASVVTSQLEDTGLTPQTKEVFDDSVPAGVVIGTDPVAGSELAPESNVTVVVSKGEQLFRVPELAGLGADDAKAAIEKAGLAVGEVTTEHSDEVKKNVVISASEKPDAELTGGTTIDLVVSKGPAPIPVPDVEGLSYDAAFATLTKRGFRVGREEVFSDTVPKGDVVFQWPKSTEAKPYDSLVIVRVSKGKEKKDEPKDDEKKDEKKKDDEKN